MARIPRNLLWCSHIHLCIFLWYKRHKVWKRSSLFKGDVATLSASHLASAVLFLLQPFCLAGNYNIFTYVFSGCTVIKTQGKGRGHGSDGLAALVLCENASWSDSGMYFSPPYILNNILYGQPGLQNHFGTRSEAHSCCAMWRARADIGYKEMLPLNPYFAPYFDSRAVHPLLPNACGENRKVNSHWW